jgi:hypothetical protein
MKVLILALLSVGALSAAPLRLGPGEYKWLPLTVQRIPTEVACRFRVLRGGPTVHMEILSASEFRRFNRGRDYDALATAPDGREGELQRLIDERGEFAVVVANEDRAPEAMVDLEVSTDLNPSEDSMVRVLSPGRRLAVIVISFGIFFGVVMWSGFRLSRAAGIRHNVRKSTAARPPL